MRRVNSINGKEGRKVAKPVMGTNICTSYFSILPFPLSLSLSFSLSSPMHAMQKYQSMTRKVLMKEPQWKMEREKICLVFFPMDGSAGFLGRCPSFWDISFDANPSLHGHHSRTTIGIARALRVHRGMQTPFPQSQEKICQFECKKPR